jgi:hypothetical protein
MQKPIHEVIAHPTANAATERDDWTGNTKRARFEGVALHERQRRASFGKRCGCFYACHCPQV